MLRNYGSVQIFGSDTNISRYLSRIKNRFNSMNVPYHSLQNLSSPNLVCKEMSKLNYTQLQFYPLFLFGLVINLEYLRKRSWGEYLDLCDRK
jgi:hypothetical protein